MKNLIKIGLILGIAVLISSNSNAQYYYTSYGNVQDWRLPSFVQHSIYDNYYGYEIAHVRRFNRHGHRNYNVLLHRNGWFVELRFDRHGHIYRTVRHRNFYPLSSHTCSGHCGYHRNYYTNYYPQYHHNFRKVVYVNSHHGHNNHVKNHNTYYTNVHVDKQHRQQAQQSQYKNHGNRSASKNVANNANVVQRRSSNVIRTPQQVNQKAAVKPKQSSSRSSYIKSQPASTRQTVSRSSGNADKYKSVRGSRNR